MTGNSIFSQTIRIANITYFRKKSQLRKDAHSAVYALANICENFVYTQCVYMRKEAVSACIRIYTHCGNLKFRAVISRKFNWTIN